jgi:hypothetical protein
MGITRRSAYSLRMYNPINIAIKPLPRARTSLIDRERNRRAMDDLLALLRTGQSYAMTGAGVSAWAGYRTWKQFIDRLAAAVTARRGAEVNTEVIVSHHPDLLFCAQALGRELSHEAFAEFIRQEFGPNGQPGHDLLFRLTQMPFRHILTLNFERSMEEAHTAVAVPRGTITCSHRPAIVAFLDSMDSPSYPRQIVHLHGIYTDPVDTIALTENGYRQLYRDNRLFQHFLWLLAATKRIVFLGFGFEDTDFLNAMRDVARDMHRDSVQRIPENWTGHFAVLPIARAQDDGPIRQNLNERYFVEPIFYELIEDGGNPYTGFPALINGIAHELVLPAPSVIRVTEPIAPEPRVEPDDFQRAADLADQLLGRIDPGGDHV